MPNLPINLGRRYSDGGAIPFPVKMSEPEEFYPSTHLEWDTEYNLPDEGTITFKYRVTRDIMEKVPKERNCIDLDLLEIVDVKPAQKSETDYGGDSLDKLKKESESE